MTVLVFKKYRGKDKEGWGIDPKKFKFKKTVKIFKKTIFV